LFYDLFLGAVGSAAAATAAAVNTHPLWVPPAASLLFVAY